MSLYCPGCGKSLKEDFEFCPHCGKNLKGKFIFCSGCGKKMPKTNNEPIKNNAPIVSPPKKSKNKFKFPKISFKNKKKILPILIIIIVLVVVIGAVAIVLLNSDNEETISGGRTFTILITNGFSENAECYLVTDNFRQGTFGNPGFTVNANDDATITIIEDDLMFQRDAYAIKLFVTIDEVSNEATATAVTESANFLIDNVPGEIDLYEVNCSDYQ
jgi:hypothetical protein